MKRFAEFSLVFALILAVGPAAFGQGRGERRGGGFGQNLLMLTSQKSVQEELKLTDEQLKVISPLAEKQREGVRGMRDASAEDRKKFEEQVAANSKTLSETLQPEQLKRLKQISLQLQGTAAFVTPEVADELKLTSEQTEKIKAMQLENRDKMREMFAGGNREEARGKMAELRKSSNEKVQAVLTDEQKSKWKALTGEPFTGEISMGGGRRRPGANQ